MASSLIFSDMSDDFVPFESAHHQPVLWLGPGLVRRKVCNLDYGIDGYWYGLIRVPAGWDSVCYRFVEDIGWVWTVIGSLTSKEVQNG